ncbi:CaiB/BaiF CoA transferase family protein [Actinophytocola oryzae]|uniref:CaiB/BaiF CoA transferase family protein n=1 Tax=Actinophytocola oryzae TaxID=502181 RepID=UPI001415169D|nr:CaiB/BaiF CoA-transferase family protein [Actinophytocola oryzae]
MTDRGVTDQGVTDQGVTKQGVTDQGVTDRGVTGQGPILEGLRVLDLSHQYSAALSASLLADLGASVIAVEHPTKTSIRTMLPRKGEQSMWWSVIQRGKRVVTLDINSERGREIAIQMAREADVICENFRPGTLERWHLGPADLTEAGVNAVMLRISGFGQTGPLRTRPGFGTIAEAISGFAHLNGEPDGPPTFPSSTLADGVAATFGAFGIMAALWGRANNGPPTGIEVVDMALFEGLFRIIPTQIAAYQQFGVAPLRPGNKLTSHGVLRNLFRSADGKWFVVSAVGPVAIRRILAAAECDAQMARIDEGVMTSDPTGVVEFLDECDALLHVWAAKWDWATLEKRLVEADAVHQQVFSADDIVADEQFQARGDLIEVPDDVLGPVLMQGVVPKFPSREHTVRRAGPARGADNDSVFAEFGLSAATITALRQDGVI